ncbi:MAG TPA: RecX family transcriptional regulator [Azospirillaceae bacterium]|nr:RecX family transcriptional regulator [Azospirillaceae bacterium]
MTDDKTPPRPRKPPKRVTAPYLEAAALHYLERFAASTAGLRRVLMAKVDRSAHAHGTNREDGARIIEDLIRKFQRLGYLNDAEFARARAASLHRRGASTRAIREKLATKGVDSDAVDAALAEVAQDTDGEVDVAAAVALARRRRLGPFRDPAKRDELRDKDLAALARAGFSYDIARRVVDADDPDDVN